MDASRRVARHLYRSLMRIGRQFDKNHQFARAFLNDKPFLRSFGVDGAFLLGQQPCCSLITNAFRSRANLEPKLVQGALNDAFRALRILNQHVFLQYIRAEEEAIAAANAAPVAASAASATPALPAASTPAATAGASKASLYARMFAPRARNGSDKLALPVSRLRGLSPSAARKMFMLSLQNADRNPDRVLQTFSFFCSQNHVFSSPSLEELVRVCRQNATLTGRFGAAIAALRQTAWAKPIVHPTPKTEAAQRTASVKLMHDAMFMADSSDFAFDLFDILVQAHGKPTVVTFMALISACQRNSSLPEERLRALSVLDKMKEFGVRPTTQIYNTVIACLCSGGLGDFKTAMGLLQRMKEDAVLPSRTTFVTLFVAAMELGHDDLVDSVQQASEAYGITVPEVEMFRDVDFDDDEEEEED